MVRISPRNSVKAVKSIIPVNNFQMAHSQVFLPQLPTRIRSLTQHPVGKCVPRYVHVLTSFTYVSDCTLLKGKGQPYHLAHCDSRHNRPCKYGTHTEPVNAPNKSMEIKALCHPLGRRQSLFSLKFTSTL